MLCVWVKNARWGSLCFWYRKRGCTPSGVGGGTPVGGAVRCGWKGASCEKENYFIKRGCNLYTVSVLCCVWCSMLAQLPILFKLACCLLLKAYKNDRKSNYSNLHGLSCEGGLFCVNLDFLPRCFM